MTRPPRDEPAEGWALLGGRRARGVVDHVDLVTQADRVTEGFWAVVADFEGPVRAWRFAEIEPHPGPATGGPWRGPRAGEWATSLDRAAYLHGVAAVRDAIREGDVYQVNLCRVLDAPLAVEHGEPDAAENVMIADMVRNDLQRVCRPGTVEVTGLLKVEAHPGLVHLVTTVRGMLLDTSWPQVLAATFPPASVSGAPKHAALGLIDHLEPVPRGPYCGAVGWLDADAGRAELAVGIRTFWWTPDGGGRLHFGTGAGITWDSDPAAEWAETELKARRLVGLASG